ncbi:MAG: helix-turn-helix domain-containing protein, partial [Streptococcaceae bacterium]|nr:helix-turn-helix domain-containing protein [Streptococcaceae bacterium]
MKTSINKRVRKVIEKLIEQPQNKLDYFLNHFSLKKSQVEYALKKINLILEDEALPLIEFDSKEIILPEKSRQYFLDAFLDDEEFFSSYEMDADERSKYIFLMLFYWQDNYLSVYHFLDSLSIGKTSFTNTSHQLEIELENSNIGIAYTREEGYFLTGAEVEIRAKLITLILEDLVIDGDDFLYRYFLIKEKIGFDDFKKVSETILKFLEKYAISLVENRLKEFSYIFFLLLPRLRKVCKEIEDKIDQKLLIGTKEYAFSKEILAHFGIENQEAIIYISSWLLGSALGDINDQGPDFQMVYEMTAHIVQRFEMLSGVRFKDKTPIIQRLYSHFRPVYYRLCFHLPIINNLYEKI